MVDKIKNRFIVFKKENIEIVEKYIDYNYDKIDAKVFHTSCCSDNIELDMFSKFDSMNHSNINLLLEYLSNKPKPNKKKIIFLVVDISREKKIKELYDQNYLDLILSLVDGAKFISKVIVIELQKRSNILNCSVDLEKMHFYNGEPIF